MIILRLLARILFWIPPVGARLEFEKRNASDPLARRFSSPADVAFEFSSEGEFQQVLPLITDGVEAGKKIELIYFSTSVEKGVRDLAQKHPENLRALRFPFLLGGLLDWITAPRLVLVRYDLFPDLLSFPGELQMIWVTFKKERSRGKSVSSWKKKFLGRSKNIIYATVADAQMGKSLGFPGEVYDFRIEQIQRRLQGKFEKFEKLFPEYGSLGLSRFPREKRLILGNVWPSDLQVFQEIPRDIFILVVPHKLEPEILSEFQKFFGDRAVVLNKKGVLCELYADFGHAYVGGGFETSIHSVLEPLISGADQISCGPRTFRSTEYDIAETAKMITVVKNSQEFGEWLKRSLETQKGDGKLEAPVKDYQSHRKAIISC